MLDQITHLSRTRTRPAMFAATLLLMSGPALAQTGLQPAQTVQDSRPRAEARAGAAPARIAAPIAVFRTSDGLVVIRLESGEPRVTIAGVEGADARVRIEDGTLTVLGADGLPIATLNLSMIAPIVGKIEIDSIVRSLEPSSRRIIGVTTNPAPAGMLDELGLQAPALVIESVTPGLPAQRAGVLPGDLITTIEGNPPATLDRLREAIAAAGDKPLRLGLMRDGNLGSLEILPVVEPAARTFTFSTAPEGAARQEVERRVRTHAAEVVRQQALSERLAVQVERLAREQAMNRTNFEDFERAARAAAEAIKTIEMKFDFDIPDMPEVSILRENGGDVAIFAPGGARGGGGWPARASNAPESRRIEIIEERLARLERLIELLLVKLAPAEQETSQNPPGD